MTMIFLWLLFHISIIALLIILVGRGLETVNNMSDTAVNVSRLAPFFGKRIQSKLGAGAMVKRKARLKASRFTRNNVVLVAI